MNVQYLKIVTVCGVLIFANGACALLGQSEKAFVDGVIAKNEHRYVMAKEFFDQVDQENRAHPLAQQESNAIAGIVDELRRAQRDGEIAYDQQRWVAAYVNYQIVAKYQPWNATAQARVQELQEKVKVPEIAPKPKPKPKPAPTTVAKRAPARSAPKAAPAPEPEPVVDEVPEDRKVEIDEKLRVSRRLVQMQEHQQLVSLLRDVVDFDYRRDEMVDAYVPALLELAQVHYAQTEYRKAAQLFEEAYRVKPEPGIEKLMTRTKQLADALDGER